MMMQFFLKLLTILFLFAGCTHHTATQQFAAPPYIVSVTPIATGHQILMRAMNPELIFAGYTLYTGATEAEASAQNNPVACSGRAMIPNLPVEYSIEASPVDGPLAVPGTGENTNRICKFQTALVSGNYIAISSQIISVNSAGLFQFRYSPPSNIVKVP